MIKNYSSLLTTLYSFIKPERNHLTGIYSILSEKFYEKKLNSDILFYTYKLLRNILSLQMEKLNQPMSFFYFTGAYSGINALPPQPMFWPFISVITP